MRCVITQLSLLGGRCAYARNTAPAGAQREDIDLLPLNKLAILTTVSLLGALRAFQI